MHLQPPAADITWCEADPENARTTDDPRDATCPDCLRRAASYGAAAAMRYAAVEAGVTQDPELERERDEAMRRLNAVNDALEKQSAFFCSDCMRLRNTKDRAVCANGVSWCKACAPGGTAA